MEGENDRIERFSKQVAALKNWSTVINIAMEGMREVFEQIDPARLVPSGGSSDLPEIGDLEDDEPTEEELARWEQWAETALSPTRTPTAAEQFEQSLGQLDALWGQRGAKAKLCRESGRCLALLHELVRGQDELVEAFSTLMEHLEGELESAEAS